jgi:hypothetical protein
MSSAHCSGGSYLLPCAGYTSYSSRSVSEQKYYDSYFIYLFFLLYFFVGHKFFFFFCVSPFSIVRNILYAMGTGYVIGYGSRDNNNVYVHVLHLCSGTWWWWLSRYYCVSSKNAQRSRNERHRANAYTGNEIQVSSERHRLPLGFCC